MSRITDDANILEEYVADGRHDWDGAHVLVLGSQDGSTSGALLVGLRFSEITIPQGSTIVAAYVALRVEEEDASPANLSFGIEVADDAADFPRHEYARAQTRHTLAMRDRSSIEVSWTDVPSTSGMVGNTMGSPDLSGLVRLVVSRQGWASGGHLNLLITGTGRRAFDGAWGAAPELLVYYVPPMQHVVVMSRVVQRADIAEELAISGQPAVSVSDEVYGADELRLRLGEINRTSSYVGGPALVGLRFSDVAVPRGATILEAYLTFYLVHGLEEDTSCRLRIYAERQADAAGFTGLQNDLSSRSLSTAHASWDLVSTVDYLLASISSTDLSTVIQEIVDLPSWASGSHINLIIDGVGSRTVMHAGPQTGPDLVISYAPTDVPPPLPPSWPT